MKKDIHPTYYENVVVHCACGNEFITGSTKKEIKVEICSACHPYFTGKEKFIDTAGRIEKFERRQKKARKKKEERVEIVDSAPETTLEASAESVNENIQQ